MKSPAEAELSGRLVADQSTIASFGGLLSMALSSSSTTALAVFSSLPAMRPGELRTSTLDQLSLAGIDLRRTKTGAHSLVLWTPELVEAIRDALAMKRKRPSDWVFAARHRRPYTVGAVNRQWARYCGRAGVEGLQMRDTRRTTASDATDLQHAQELLGHGDSRITKRVYKIRTVVRPVR